MKLPLGAGRFTVSGNDVDSLDGMHPQVQPDVSVVVPYYDNQHDLDLILRALRLQTYPTTKLQVIVADDGSPVGPSLNEGKDLVVTTVHQQRDGFRAAAARNLGAAHADGSVLCFLDGDTVPEPGYITAATRLPALCPDALVTGRRLHTDLSGVDPEALENLLSTGHAPPTPFTEPGWLVDGLRSTRDLRQANDASYRFVLSAVLTIGHDLFADVGGFDEGFTRYGGEDWELAHRAWKAGCVLAHEPTARAWHNGPDWAEREPNQTSKNAETARLARQLPVAGARGRGLIHRRARTVARIDANGWDPAALQICVDSLLQLHDIRIHIMGADLSDFRDDPRVQHADRHPQPEPNALTLLDVHAPCLIADIPTMFGRALIRDEHGPLITVSQSRATARAARWRDHHPDKDLVEALFGSAVLSTGATRVSDQPDLAAYFGAWGEFSSKPR